MHRTDDALHRMVGQTTDGFERLDEPELEEQRDVDAGHDDDEKQEHADRAGMQERVRPGRPRGAAQRGVGAGVEALDRPAGR